MDVSILILNYNTCQLTMDCIHSVFASQTRYEYEIILIDNNSSDNSVEVLSRTFPSIRMIVNKENVGFAKANNQGMRIAGGRYVLLLNSDTVIQPDTIQTMVDYMDRNPHAGAAGCKVLLADGSLDKTCKRGLPTPSASFYYMFGISKMFPDKPKYNQYQLSYLDPDKEHAVDCLVGAFMLVRAEVIREVGMLDENFFMYGEDLDWCYRIKQAGWAIRYYPATFILHYKGASSKRRPVKLLYEFHRAMVIFYRKHYREKYAWPVNGFIYTGIGVKFAATLIRNRLRPVKDTQDPPTGGGESPALPVRGEACSAKISNF
ncbi:glycosyltransferase family 2 protein [Saccharibacillus kuerlensis]|uniref:Glycosyl transferase n=1 Tax=Saccharibacillus kuerlensis TaxID=459527 RepID=A0ABQ2KUL5_9BACL|nr:glycosyltransferase family 2 protein [Saccharibacillus kuerlensis]GGN92912.1 glycosyl transferase [Saccharibacillus kuerlensis]